MLNVFRIILCLLSALLMGGCTPGRALPAVSADLGEKGLLVARFYVLGMQSMETASAEIDGKLIPSSMINGYLVTPLSPGEHTFTQIRTEGRRVAQNTIEESSPIRHVKGGAAPIIISIPGGSYKIYYSTLSVDRTFRIEAGKATNLGLMIFIPTSEANRGSVNSDKPRDFTLIELNNNDETTKFLNINYPEVVQSLTDKNPILAPGHYLDPADLPKVRRIIAYHESTGPNVVTSENRKVIYGRAGTIVALTKSPNSPQGKLDLDILNTETLADIVGGSNYGNLYTFITSDAQLITWDGVEIRRKPLPFQIHPSKFHQLRDGTLVVVDNHLRIYSSGPNSEKWERFEESKTSYPRGDISMTADRNGVYISHGERGVPEATYYFEAGAPRPTVITSPESAPGVSRIDLSTRIATHAGLFVIYSKPTFYFWSKSIKRWTTNSTPIGNCQPMKIEDDGVNLRITCDGVDYRSENSGATWIKVMI